MTASDHYFSLQHLSSDNQYGTQFNMISFNLKVNTSDQNKTLSDNKCFDNEVFDFYKYFN